MLNLRSVYRNVQRRFASTEPDEDIFEIKPYFWKNRVEVNKTKKEFINAMNSDPVDDDDEDDDEHEQKVEIGIHGELAKPAYEYYLLLHDQIHDKTTKGSKFMRIRTFRDG